MDPKAKLSFIKCLVGFKDVKVKMRLAIVNMQCIINGVQGMDAFVGMELEAQARVHMKQGPVATIVIDV